jgi:hypothetical protein
MDLLLGPEAEGRKERRRRLRGRVWALGFNRQRKELKAEEGDSIVRQHGTKTPCTYPVGRGLWRRAMWSWAGRVAGRAGGEREERESGPPEVLK